MPCDGTSPSRRTRQQATDSLQGVGFHEAAICAGIPATDAAHHALLTHARTRDRHGLVAALAGAVRPCRSKTAKCAPARVSRPDSKRHVPAALAGMELAPAPQRT